ncbi:MAG: hypothetical protein QOF53_2254 [Nocardioidaceae bacterium]|jgi:acyl dehydratase/uncharacterized OsmC-like protein|nr:hypothetical protein [Nocardioidaceae bacterium]
MTTTQIGASARRTRTVTSRDIELFSEISGDRNPLHYDEALAARSRFGGLVVQGGVTSGLLNALVAEQLPGPGSVFLEVAWHFRAPVRPGDVITAEAVVLGVREDKPVTTLATSVTNQDGVTVLDGSAVVWRDPVVATAHRSTPSTPASRRTSPVGEVMTVTESPRRNGVDTAALFATRDAVKATNEIAAFQFRATNTWVSGTHSRSTFSGFYGAMQELEHEKPMVVEADHPAILVGQDHAPTPVEHLLHAIAACLTAGIANVAAARGVDLTTVTSTVEGDIDLLGVLGLSDSAVRNGYERIKVTLKVEGDADDETLRGIVEQSRRRSAVYDALTNPTPVVIDVVTG